MVGDWVGARPGKVDLVDEGCYGRLLIRLESLMTQVSCGLVMSII